jgi:hypothetical protein
LNKTRHLLSYLNLAFIFSSLALTTQAVPITAAASDGQLLTTVSSGMMAEEAARNPGTWYSWLTFGTLWTDFPIYVAAGDAGNGAPSAQPAPGLANGASGPITGTPSAPSGGLHVGSTAQNSSLVDLTIAPPPAAPAMGGGTASLPSSGYQNPIEIPSPAESVPDGGNTNILLGCALLVLFIVGRRYAV